MGQLGFQELAVIFLIALLVFGPKKLPELGKSLGKGLREFKRATNDLKASWDEQVRESEISEAAKDFRTIRKDLDEELRQADRPAPSDPPNAPPADVPDVPKDGAAASDPSPTGALSEERSGKSSEKPSEKPS